MRIRLLFVFLLLLPCSVVMSTASNEYRTHGWLAGLGETMATNKTDVVNTKANSLLYAPAQVDKTHTKTKLSLKP